MNGHCLPQQVPTPWPKSCRLCRVESQAVSGPIQSWAITSCAEQHRHTAFLLSLVSLNRVAFLAVRTRPADEIIANDAFSQISDDQWDEETWKWKKDFELAKNFAAFRVPELKLEAAADANMKTPEGLQYRSSFEKLYKDLLQKCVGPADADVGKFKTFTKVGFR